MLCLHTEICTLTGQEIFKGEGGQEALPALPCPLASAVRCVHPPTPPHSSHGSHQSPLWSCWKAQAHQLCNETSIYDRVFSAQWSWSATAISLAQISTYWDERPPPIHCGHRWHGGMSSCRITELQMNQRKHCKHVLLNHTDERGTPTPGQETSLWHTSHSHTCMCAQ